MKTHPFTKLPGSIGPICQTCGLHSNGPVHHEPFGEDIPAEVVEVPSIINQIKPQQFGNKSVEYVDLTERIPVIDQALDLINLLPEDSEDRETLLRASCAVLRAYLTPAYIIKPEA